MSQKNKDQDTSKENSLKEIKTYINEFGEVVISNTQEEINKFLDENLEDKKLSDKNKK